MKNLSCLDIFYMLNKLNNGISIYLIHWIEYRHVEYSKLNVIKESTSDTCTLSKTGLIQ